MTNGEKNTSQMRRCVVLKVQNQYLKIPMSLILHLFTDNKKSKFNNSSFTKAIIDTYINMYFLLFTKGDLINIFLDNIKQTNQLTNIQMHFSY